MLARAPSSGLVARRAARAQSNMPLVAPTKIRGIGGRVPVRQVITSAAETEEADVSVKFNEWASNTASYLKMKWEETEDKPAAIAVTAFALLALTTVSGIVDAVDKIPIVSDAVELVGVGVTGWFAYRYLVFGPDREELVSDIKTFINKVYGK